MRDCVHFTRLSQTNTSQGIDETDGTDDMPTWRGWSLSRWFKHETEVQKRRAVEVDPQNTDKFLPPRGDEERGWRSHWRRGLLGAVRDWAEGSPFRVAFMLAELAKSFNVVDAVSHSSHSPMKHFALLASKQP